MKYAFILLIFLSSCKYTKVIIVDKLDPIDYHISHVYPIKDTLSCTLGVRPVNDSHVVVYIKDRTCKILSTHGMGDTIWINSKKLLTL